MIVVPPGSFTIGSPEDEVTNDWDRGRDEGPQHIVTFSRAFAVGKVEVTVDQFAAFIKESGYDAGSQCFTFETRQCRIEIGPVVSQSRLSPTRPTSGDVHQLG